MAQVQALRIGLLSSNFLFSLRYLIHGGEKKKGGGDGGQDLFHGAFLCCPDTQAIYRHSEICTTES